MKKIVILFSGQGSNLEALARALLGRVEIVAITNNPNAGGIERAKALGIPVTIIDHRAFSSREEFDAALVGDIKRHAPDLVVLAGFMRLLSRVFTDAVANAINIHPSLLPLFKGKDGIGESFRSGMKVGGVTVHRVTEQMDSGEILAQVCVPILETDTRESYEARVHEAEHRLYPQVVARLLGLVG